VAFHDFTERSSWFTLNKLLDRLLIVTKSQYGFIAQKFHTKDDVLAVQVEAVTNIAWTPELEKVSQPVANL
jgi:hypothetical protein